jgi:hypothetical protein
VGFAVEGLEGFGLAEVEDGFCADEPVAVLGVGKVGDDGVWSPGVFAFVLQRPSFREVAEKGVESGWRASEEGDSLGQGMFHRDPRFVDAMSGDLIIFVH